MVIGVGIGLGEPDHLFGIHRLAVDNGGNLPVGAAGIKANAAALEVAANLLGSVLALGHGIHQQNLEGMLKDVCHIVPVEFLLAAGAVDAAQVVINHLIAADIDAEAALHPQQEFHQPVDVEAIRLLHLGGTVDEGMAAGHFALGPLHGNGYRLFGICQEGLVEQMQRDEFRIQLGTVLN